MTDASQTLSELLQQRFEGTLIACTEAYSETTIQVPPKQCHDVCRALHDEAEFSFEMLIDLCAVDYLEYENSNNGRFAVVYHLLSIKNNQRVRVKTYLDSETPRIASVIDIWACANWFEREAYDLFGILFDGHPDLRRLLTDYGFIGYPFRKDFPLSGHVEMRYDPEKKRVIYEPVSIEPRITVPRVIRHDHRYVENNNDGSDNG